MPVTRPRPILRPRRQSLRYRIAMKIAQLPGGFASRMRTWGDHHLWLIERRENRATWRRLRNPGSQPRGPWTPNVSGGMSIPRRGPPAHPPSSPGEIRGQMFPTKTPVEITELIIRQWPSVTSMVPTQILIGRSWSPSALRQNVGTAGIRFAREYGQSAAMSANYVANPK